MQLIKREGNPQICLSAFLSQNTLHLSQNLNIHCVSQCIFKSNLSNIWFLKEKRLIFSRRYKLALSCLIPTNPTPPVVSLISNIGPFIQPNFFSNKISSTERLLTSFQNYVRVIDMGWVQIEKVSRWIDTWVLLLLKRCTNNTESQQQFAEQYEKQRRLRISKYNRYVVVHRII